MVLRIEQSSIFVTPTADPQVVRVDADVTKDDETVENPTFEHVSVLWNTTTAKTVLKEAMRIALKDNSVQDNLRSTIGEVIKPASTPTDPTLPSFTINAASVTVNQTGGGT